MAWLQLLRISAVPSAISNILAGWLIAHGSWQPIFPLAAVIMCSCLLYMSGMVLNDWHDAAADSRDRPGRPIPSGRIPRHTAGLLYLGLTSAGLIIAALAGPSSLAIAGMLVLAIVGYNVLLKQTVIAPVAMGLCRTLNVLLGASFTADGVLPTPALTSAEIWVVAASIGLVVTGLTWFARYESEGNQTKREVQTKLLLAAATVIAGFLLLAIAALSPEQFEIFLPEKTIRFVIILALICLPIAMRITAAIGSASPASVRTAVITMLRSLILIDAAICYVAAPAGVLYALATISLLVPAMLLSKWISPT